MQLINQDFTKFSTTAQNIMFHQLGYRNEAISISDYRNLSIDDILNFEINELDNDDILDFMKSHKYIATSSQSKSKQIENIEHYLVQQFNQPIDRLYGLWLTDNEGIDIYNYTENEDIIKYNLTDYANTFIISDLDEDGILIVTSNAERPKELA